MRASIIMFISTMIANIRIIAIAILVSLHVRYDYDKHLVLLSLL